MSSISFRFQSMLLKHVQISDVFSIFCKMVLYFSVIGLFLNKMETRNCFFEIRTCSLYITFIYSSYLFKTSIIYCFFLFICYILFICPMILASCCCVFYSYSYSTLLSQTIQYNTMQYHILHKTFGFMPFMCV